MKDDDTKISITWDAHACTYRAKVEYGGNTTRFAVTEAVNTEDAMDRVKRIMYAYKREVG